ncbi:C16orf70 [Bugula neritina]|uniref:C16orf70 n=1 Tax=Bugula neritina TaxID=10212 RepID=A0A7J7J9V3_BUGNE|nr:C16orf70 [Bugula neritina]
MILKTKEVYAQYERSVVWFDKEIQEIQVWYSDQNPLMNDLVLNLSRDGIKLIFDPYNQRLKMIEINDMEKVSLKYHGKHFNSPTVSPTIEQINQSFGSTTPCTEIFDENKQRFVMNFRGLAFFFSADDAQTHPEGGARSGYRRLSSPSGIIKVTKLQIYHGASFTESQAPEIPLSVYNGICFLVKADVERANNMFSSLKLTLNTHKLGADNEEIRQFQTSITFGLPAQEVDSRLGAPTKIYYKSHDKMKIHSPVDRQREGLKSDYIYNYFSLGLDLIFDGASHKLKKILLHTNYPGHYNFNIYMRCNFTIPLTLELSAEQRMSNPYQSEQLSITPYTKWNDIVPSNRQAPVVLRRKESLNSINPFWLHLLPWLTRHDIRGGKLSSLL